MATIPVFNEAGLLSLLGDELYYNYFATEEGGAGNSNNSADESSDTTTGAEDCTLESLVDNILLKASLELSTTNMLKAYLSTRPSSLSAFMISNTHRVAVDNSSMQKYAVRIKSVIFLILSSTKISREWLKVTGTCDWLL